MVSNIQSIQPITSLFEDKKQAAEEISVNAPTFLDVFRSIAGEAVSTQNQKAQDILDIMLGDVDSLETIQTNIVKAQIAMDLLVNTRNAVLESYNEIIKMSI